MFMFGPVRFCSRRPTLHPLGIPERPLPSHVATAPSPPPQNTPCGVHFPSCPLGGGMLLHGEAG